MLNSRVWNVLPLALALVGFGSFAEAIPIELCTRYPNDPLCKEERQQREFKEYFPEEFEELKSDVLAAEFEKSLPRVLELYDEGKVDGYFNDNPASYISLLELVVDISEQTKNYSLLEKFSKELLDFYAKEGFEEEAREWRNKFLEAKRKNQEGLAGGTRVPQTEQRCSKSDLSSIKDMDDLIDAYLGCPISTFFRVTGLLPTDRYTIPGGNEQLLFTVEFTERYTDTWSSAFRCDYQVEFSNQEAKIVNIESKWWSDAIFDSGKSECRDILRGKSVGF